MAYTEYRRSRESLTDQSIKPRLGSLVHCRGRLIKEKPIRFLNQRPSEGDPLLLAGRELEGPMEVLAESPA